GMLDYKLEGKSLGGTFDLEGQIPAGAKPEDATKEKVKKGRLSIQNVQVARLFSAMNLETTRDLRGTLNLEVHFTHDTSDRFPQRPRRGPPPEPALEDPELARHPQRHRLLSEAENPLPNPGSHNPQGTFSGQLTYYLRQPERSWFTLNLDRVESGQILAAWL